MAGGDFTVVPNKDIDHDNGVTTFDLVLMRQHVLSTQLLDSPYKMIAADANNSQSITTADIVLLRMLILTIIDELPSNTSWRFVDADYEFPNPANPWEETFPEIISYNNLTEDRDDTDFIGIKIGDVNGNAQANGLMNNGDERGTGSLNFRTEKNRVKAGEEVTVQFSAERTDISGVQFTLGYDLNNLTFNRIEESSFYLENFGLHRTAEGLITASWDKQGEEQAEFALTFTAQTDGELSDWLSFNSRLTRAEAYTLSGEVLDIELVFGEENSTPNFALYQNTPNPFRDKTLIGFVLPEAEEAIFEVYDVSGRLVYTCLLYTSPSPRDS